MEMREEIEIDQEFLELLEWTRNSLLSKLR